MIPYSQLLEDSDLDKLVRRARDYNAPMHELMRKAREYNLMLQRVELPPGVRKTRIEVRNAFVWDMTQRMTAATIKNFPRVEAIADDITQEGERRASKKERHSGGALKRAAMEAGTHQDPFARATWAQYGSGMGVDNWIYRPDRWGPWPARNGASPSKYQETVRRWKMAHFPFMWRAIDPLCYNPLYGDEGKYFVAEISQRALPDLENRFGEEDVKSVAQLLESGIQGPEGGSAMGGTVEFQELWTFGYIYYRIRGKTIYKVPNPCPFLPYYESRGITTEANIPGQDSLPLTYALLKFAPLLDTMFTVIAEGFMIAGIPTPFLKPDKDSPALLYDQHGQPIQQDIALGQINPVAGDISMPLSQAMPNMLNDSLRAILNLAEATMLPPALRGQGIGSDWSGYLANTVLHTVLTLLATPLRSREMALAQMIRDYWWTIQHRLGTEVWVWQRQRSGRGKWAPLGPEDIQDFYEVDVHMRPSLPKDEAAWLQIGLTLWERGAIDLRTFLNDFYEAEYPDEIEERLMLERLMKMPEIDQVRLISLLQRLAPDSPVIQDVLASLMPQQPALPPGGGFPGAQPGLQEAAPFAAGAIGGGLAGGEGAVPFVGGRPAGGPMGAVPGGPRMTP